MLAESARLHQRLYARSTSRRSAPGRGRAGHRVSPSSCNGHCLSHLISASITRPAGREPGYRRSSRSTISRIFRPSTLCRRTCPGMRVERMGAGRSPEERHPERPEHPGVGHHTEMKEEDVEDDIDCKMHVKIPGSPRPASSRGHVVPVHPWAPAICEGAYTRRALQQGRLPSGDAGRCRHRGERKEVAGYVARFWRSCINPPDADEKVL